MQTENCLHLFQIKRAPCGIRLLQQFLNFYFEEESCLCPVCVAFFSKLHSSESKRQMEMQQSAGEQSNHKEVFGSAPSF